MSVNLALFPYHRSKWPARGPIIHTENGEIDLVQAFYNEIRPLAKPIPRRVGLFLKDDPDLGIEEELTQVNGYGDPLSYALAGEIADGIKEYLKTYVGTQLEPRIPDSWVKAKLKRVRKLGKNRPVILYWS